MTWKGIAKFAGFGVGTIVSFVGTGIVSGTIIIRLYNALTGNEVEHAWNPPEAILAALVSMVCCGLVGLWIGATLQK